MILMGSHQPKPVHRPSFQQVNSVGFYQLSKICITPAVLVFDAVTTSKYPTRKEVGAVCVLCVGVTLATLTDHSVTTNMLGVAVALAAICFTAVYQVPPPLPIPSTPDLNWQCPSWFQVGVCWATLCTPSSD